jgi:glycosyltransferase involved in cell wall biosynthesis
MKILCISNYYPPFFEGGYEISVKETMDFLIGLGHAVFILCGNKGMTRDEAAAEEALKPGEPHRVLRYIDYLRPSFKDKHRVEKHNYGHTTQALQSIEPDLVYLGNMKGISIAPVLAVQNSKYPKVFDMGDIWPAVYLRSGIKSLVYRSLKQMIPFTVGGRMILDPVIVPSSWMKEEFSRQFKSRSIHLVPRGIALPPENPRPVGKPLRFVFAGRIEPMKGLELCIQAASRVLAEYQDFCLDIYGDEDESYAERCKALIKKLHLQEHFNFLGKTLDINKILPNYDVLLMPTMAKEAFGRIVVEAMAAKVIVIATDAFGPKEIISSSHDGFLFKRGSSASLASAILHVYQMIPQHLEQMRSQARETVETRYEINLVKMRLVNILENIIKEAKQPQRGTK